MPDYEFYTQVYGGKNIPQEEFAGYVTRAAAELDYYEQVYRVRERTGVSEGRGKAICAIASVMHWYDVQQEATRSVRVGSVSCGAGQAPDDAEYRRNVLAACERYLYIYRGTRENLV